MKLLLAVAVIVLAVAAHLFRYSIIPTPAGGVFVLDRWTGRVALCAAAQCAVVHPPVNGWAGDSK